MIAASIVADSVNAQGNRLTTFKLRYPWFIHGELMTHRVLSRNASSNRAIPLAKMLEEARSDDLRAEPVYWGAEQKGMEPGGELGRTRPLATQSDPLPMSPYEEARMWWKSAAMQAANCAQAMSMGGAHKSLCNRVLMPYTHANVVVTATEWDNFFGLRLDKAADPTMRALAVKMWEERAKSVPKLLQPGKWHLPFADDWGTTHDLEEFINQKQRFELGTDDLIKISVARCARVSYESFETGRRSTVEEDLRLYDRLVGAQPLHASPAEHQATPDEPDTYSISVPKQTEEQKAARFVPLTMEIKMKHPEQWGNFVGWRQYRQMLPGQAVAPLPEDYR